MGGREKRTGRVFIAKREKKKKKKKKLSSCCSRPFCSPLPSLLPSKWPGEFQYDAAAVKGHLPLTNALRGTQLFEAILEHPAFAEGGQKPGGGGPARL